MTDLDAQIREKLKKMRHNAQKCGIDADEERDGRLWRVSGDTETAANALLAVLDATDLETYPPNYCQCGKCLKRWLRELIAEKLGVDEAEQAPATVQAAYDITASRHDERREHGEA